jgi:hypothetical protein
MPLHQRDFILRLIEQAGVAVARLKALLGLGGAAEAETVLHEAEGAQSALLGPIWPTVRLLDPASAAMLVGDPRRVSAWAELLRLQAAAYEIRGDAAEAERLTKQAEALEREAGRLKHAAGGGAGTTDPAVQT